MFTHTLAITSINLNILGLSYLLPLNKVNFSSSFADVVTYCLSFTYYLSSNIVIVKRKQR